MDNFLLLVLQFFLIGIGPYFFLTRIFKEITVPHLITFSIIWGMLIQTLVILTVGHFGLPVTGTLSTVLVLVCTGASIGYASFHITSENLLSKAKNTLKTFFKERNTLKAIVYNAPFLLVIALFLLLFVVNSKIYTPVYDHFSYWLIDAKEIFTSGALRSDTNVTSTFDYSSFYPLHTVFLYEKFGYLVEQYANYITLLYGLLASSLVYLQTYKKKLTTKLLVVSLLLIINADMANYLLRFYADITTSFYVLLISVIALHPAKMRHYPIKLFIIIMTLFALSLIKTPNIIYCIIIGATFCLYERKRLLNFFHQNLQQNIAQIGVLLSVIVVLVVARIYYLDFVFVSPEAYTVSTHLSTIKSPDLSTWFDNAALIFKLLLSEHQILAGTLFALLITIRSNEKSPTILLLAMITFLLPATNVFYYVLRSYYSSIGRYVTTVFYLIPLITSLIDLKKIKKSVQVIILTSILFLAILSTKEVYSQYKDLTTLPNHTGRYLDEPHNRKIVHKAQTVQENIGDKSIIAISEKEDALLPLFSKSLELRIYRYFLVENIRGGDFAIDYEQLEELLCETEVEYVLIVTSGPFLEEQFSVTGPGPHLVEINNCQPLSSTVIPVFTGDE